METVLGDKIVGVSAMKEEIMIVLDNCIGDNSSYSIDPEQARWIKDLIEKVEDIEEVLGRPIE